MTDKLTYEQMVAGLHSLEVHELHSLNKQLIQIARAKSRITSLEGAVAHAAKFQIGDVIEFYKEGRGRGAGLNYFIYEKLNRNGDCMQGPSCNKDGVKDPIATRWTVTLTQPSLKVVRRGGKPYKAAA